MRFLDVEAADSLVCGLGICDRVNLGKTLGVDQSLSFTSFISLVVKRDISLRKAKTPQTTPRQRVYLTLQLTKLPSLG